MGSLFSHRKSRVTKTDHAMLQLKSLRDKYSIQEGQINTRSKQHFDKAVSLKKSNDNSKALYHFKRFKISQKCLEKLESNIISIEDAIDSLNEAQHTAQLVKCLKEGQNALTSILAFSDMNVDTVQDILDDGQELHQQVMDLNNMITQFDSTQGEQYDLDEMEMEFISLGKDPEVDVSKEQLVLDFPNVPTEKIKFEPTLTSLTKNAKIKEKEVDKVVEMA